MCRSHLAGQLTAAAKVLTLGLLGGALTLGSQSAGAADFRIETKVFAPGQEKPISENVTVFAGGVVYDYNTLLREISILDAHPAPGRNRFMLLDPARKVQTEIKLDFIDEFTTKIKATAAESPSPFIKFLATPRFTEGFQNNTLSLKSEPVDYEITTTRAPKPEFVAQYREFSDWYAKLNTLTNPAGMPPFARMRANALLQQYQAVPQEVTLTLKVDPRSGENIVYRSQHRVTWNLLQSDAQQIHQIDAMRASFEKVDAETYFKNAPQPQPQTDQ